MTLTLPRLNGIVAISDQPASRAFSRLWDGMCSSLETAFNGAVALGDQIDELAQGVAVRNADNEFTGNNVFDAPPDSPNGYNVQGNTVVSERQTGWTAGTGTEDIGAFASYNGQAITVGYSQTQVQALDDATRDASQRLLGIEAALRAHGLIDG